MIFFYVNMLVFCIYENDVGWVIDGPSCEFKISLFLYICICIANNENKLAPNGFVAFFDLLVGEKHFDQRLLYVADTNWKILPGLTLKM